MDDRSWDRVLPALANNRRVVIITGPGHGGSTDPGHRYDLRQCAFAAGQVLDSLEIGEAVDWLGNAWGGHVGLRFAVDQFPRCRSLVMIGTPVASLSRGERLQTRVLVATYRLFGPINLVTSGVIDVLLSPHSRAHDSEAVVLVSDGLKRADRRMLINAVSSISLHREDLTDLLRELTVPTLMITGSDHSGFTPEQAETAARLIPQAQAVVVPNSAYLVPLEAPATTASLVREFWSGTSHID
jgi:pimeloyl-ACP methyl ester carboxylesterase